MRDFIEPVGFILRNILFEFDVIISTKGVGGTLKSKSKMI